MEYLVFLIPIVAIVGGLLMGAFKEWLKFKSKQNRIGASTHELEGTVSTLREALEASEARSVRLNERVQNLETIVTSQTWDALHEDGTRALPEDRREGLSGKEEELGETEKAQQLARRMQV